MSVVTGIVLYVIIWWTVVFMILPLDIKNADPKVEGMMPGAPDRPQLKRKALITTAVSCVVWLLVFAVTKSDLISFRAMTENLPL